MKREKLLKFLKDWHRTLFENTNLTHEQYVDKWLLDEQKCLCEFCNNKDKKGKFIGNECLPFDCGGLCIDINGNQLKISYDAYSCDSSFSTDTTINFCPMCGRNLNIKI